MAAETASHFIAEFNDVGQTADSGRTGMYAVELSAATGITTLLNSSTSSTKFGLAFTNILNILLNQLCVEAGVPSTDANFTPFAAELTAIGTKTGLAVPNGLNQTSFNTYMTSELLSTDPPMIKFIKYGIAFIGAHYYIYFTHYSTQTVKTSFNDLNSDLFPSFYKQLSTGDALDRITCFVEVAQLFIVYSNGTRNSTNFNTFKTALNTAISTVTNPVLTIPNTVTFTTGPTDIQYIYMTGSDINNSACVFVTEMVLMGLYHYAWYGKNVYKIQ